MRTRTSIAIIFFILCILTIGAGIYLTVASVAPANILPTSPSTPTPAATAIATATVSPTSTPTVVQKFGDAENTIFNLSLTILTYFATVLVSVLVLLLLLRIWNLSGKSNLVIDTFNNATGNDTIDKELGGLNQLTRELLARELAQVQSLVSEYNDQGLDRFTGCPPPETATDVQLSTILKSLVDVSSGETKTAVQLLNIVLIPRGTKVITTLHSFSATPATFGLSFEVLDLEGKKEPVAVTFWEPSPASPSGTRRQSASTDAGIPVALSPQLAQSYYELGMLLDHAGLYEDAITYFELALKQDGNSNQAVIGLGAALSRMQVQKSGVSAYGVGKQLQGAGLLRPAIEKYTLPLLPQHQVAAEEAWETVLKLRHGDEANAYFVLGELYEEDGVYLFDESLDMYKTAITKGSQPAIAALQARQQESASNLSAVAQILFGLKQFNDAEKYATMALAKIPGNLDAQKLLANVKEYKPLQDNNDALAAYNLGSMYEQRGALDDAINQYEAALKAQPDYEEASTALKRVLQNRRTADQRFLDLLRPAVRWLAIELALRSMEDQRRGWKRFFSWKYWRSNEWRINYRAKVYNYFGYFYQISAPLFPNYDQFYDWASIVFKRASQFDKKWFLPHVNLGVTRMMMALKAIKRPVPLLLSNKGIGYIYQALPYFEKAQKLFDEYKKKQPEKKRPETERMINLYLSTAQLLSRDPSLIQTAKDAIVAMKTGWNLDDELNSYILYNLACWYGIADSIDIGVDQAREKARRNIIRSLAREIDFWNQAIKDPSLKSIATAQEWQKLYSLLLQKKEKFPQLPECQGEQFANVITNILQQMQWP